MNTDERLAVLETKVGDLVDSVGKIDGKINWLFTTIFLTLLATCGYLAKDKINAIPNARAEVRTSFGSNSAYR